MNLDKIEKTIGGYPVKCLVYKINLGIITGLIKAPVNDDIRVNGWVGCAWRTNGCVIHKKERKRKLKIKDEFNLDIQKDLLSLTHDRSTSRSISTQKTRSISFRSIFACGKTKG
jgi:hypothetical protein